MKYLILLMFTSPAFAAVTLKCDVTVITKAGKEIKCGSATLVWDTNWDGKTPDLSFQRGVGSCKDLTLHMGDYQADKTARHNYHLIVGVQAKDGIRQSTQVAFYDQFPAQFNLSPNFSFGTGEYECTAHSDPPVAAEPETTMRALSTSIGPGTCYSAPTCSGFVKSRNTSTGACSRSGGLSWKANTGGLCVRL